jgi:hypothetical protein
MRGQIGMNVRQQVYMGSVGNDHEPSFCFRAVSRVIAAFSSASSFNA